MTFSKKLVTLSLGALALFSCGGEKDHESHHEGMDSTHAVAKDTSAYNVSDSTKFKFDFAIANIPSPASTLQDMFAYGLPYNNSFLNDLKNATTYTTEHKRSINLGIYNIDMAYAMVYEKGEDVLRYMKDVLVISDALGLKNAVSLMVGKRAEANLNNKDSLFVILDEIFVKSDSYLRTNERVYTAGTVFAGSWLESLYLNCKIAEQLTDEKLKMKAMTHLWEQRFHLGNLINLLGDYKDKKDCAELISKLSPIHAEIVSVKQPSELTNDKFKSISGKIYDLRAMLTK